MKNAIGIVLMSLFVSATNLSWNAFGGEANTNFTVPFLATRVVFDPSRPYAYLSDSGDNALVVVNLTNGVVEHQFALDWPPESITISPNGQSMCVALLTQPHGYGSFGPYTNYIAEFDLSAQAKTNEIQIPIDPGDLALTDHGILVVAGGSGQWTALETFQTSDGSLLGTIDQVYMLGKLALHPAQDAVYLATTQLSPADIYRYDFDPATGVFGATWGSPYWGNYGMGGVWCSPSGTNLVTPPGDIFSSSATEANDLIYQTTLSGGRFTGVDFDPNDGALFTVSATALCYYNLQSFELVQTQALPNGASYVHTAGTNLFVVSVQNGQTVFQQYANPAFGAATNQAPVAMFTMTPTNPTTLTTIFFDASATTSDQGRGSALQYRWSWGENPGQFDTVWTNSPTATHNYDIAGTKAVMLEVKDRYGATSFASTTVNVAFQADPGSPGSTNAPFDVGAVATRVVFDPVRPYAYLTVYDQKTLLVVNLTNGFIERQFTFDWYPESITISPNGQSMCVALLTQPHGYYSFGPYTNYIAEFDLSAQEKTNEIQIPIDPGDLALTDHGILVVAGGSGQWTALETFQTSDGSLLGTADQVFMLGKLALHPAQDAVYLATTQLSPADIYRYDFDPATGVFGSAWGSPYWGNYGMGGVWCSPSGTNLVTPPGDIFSSSATEANDLIYQTTLSGGSVAAIAFDVPHSALLAIGSSSGEPVLSHYDLSSLNLLDMTTLTNNPTYVYAKNRDVFVAWTTSSDTFFQRLQNPALPDPFITQQPASQTVIAGGEVVLSVQNRGQTPFSYQWYFDSNPLTGQTNQTLIRNGATTNQAGYYSVVVSNPYGAVTSSVAQVTLLTLPGVVRQPVSTNILAGRSLWLSVSATGSKPLSYQWNFQETPIPGATNSSCELWDVQSANEGVYSVSISNSAGTTNSTLALVRVLPAKPVIVTNPVSLTLSAGSDAIFTVAAIGSEPFVCQWLFNGRAIPGATGAQLVLANIQAGNDGRYSAKVSNSMGSSTSQSANLKVQPRAPYFVIQPASTVMLFGSTLTLSSQALGSQPINYQWYFQGHLLRNQNHSELTLANVTTAAAGDYRVVAANKFGTASSSTVQVTVNVPPQPVRLLTNQIVKVGQNVTLAFAVSGDQPINYTWQFNGALISWTNSVLVLTSIQAAQAGYYEVTATNEFGSYSSIGKVSLIGPASRLVAWGDNTGGQTNVPASLTNVVAAAAGDFHSIAVRANGAVVAWGDNSDGQTNLPAHLPAIVSIAAGANHNLAIGANGSLFAWGNNASGQCSLPVSATNQPLAVSAGDAHSLALLAGGTVIAWGDDTYGQINLPDVLTPFYYWYWWGSWPNPNWVPAAAIAAGRNHSLALLTNGWVVAWGDDSAGQCDVPGDLTNAIAVAGGYLHSVALRPDGTLVAWGDDTFGQTNIPPGLTDVVAIAAGDFNTLALLANGKVVGWGDNSYGQDNIPTNVTNAVGIVSGYYHSLALISSVRPTTPVPLQAQVIANRLQIHWQGGGVLQWAPSPAGPFTDVPNHGNSYTNVDISVPAKFFRLRN